MAPVVQVSVPGQVQHDSTRGLLGADAVHPICDGVDDVPSVCGGQIGLVQAVGETTGQEVLRDLVCVLGGVGQGDVRTAAVVDPQREDRPSQMHLHDL